MGRQIRFHMLAEDQADFLRFVRTKDDVALILSEGESESITGLHKELDIRNFHSLSLWNRIVLPQLKRTRIPNTGVYQLDLFNLPIVEFRPSILTIWEEKPALIQGRLYGIFDPYLQKPAEFERWYNTLVRWIRAKFRRNPTEMGGYVGPKAYEFFNNGGFLLPSYRPARTEVWLEYLGKQHSTHSPK